MINRVQLLRNVGQFDSVDAGAAIPLARYVLIYAENGRGKTTLTAILRSLATGDALPISERRRLGAAAPPHIVLQCAGEVAPAIFQNGRWNRTHPGMMIFDDRFVNENVYSGLEVASGHRQNLHELVLGASGVTLNRQLQELVTRVEAHNAEIRTKAAEIPVRIRGALSVDQFCELPVVEDIDIQIRLVERGLAAAHEQDAVRNTPAFDVLELPPFDLGRVAALLERDLPSLDAAAAAHVQEHFLRLGRDGEGWVADGMRRIVRTPEGREICPFCAQDLALSAVLRHYRAYFGREYRALKEDIAAALAETNLVHFRDLPVQFERAVRIAVERRQFWSNFCDVPEIDLDTELVVHEWQTTRDALIALLQAKQASPLERMEVPEAVSVSLPRFEVQREMVATVNQRLQQSGGSIAAAKQRAAAANLNEISAELERLKTIQVRHTADVSALCEEYVAARVAKVLTEEARERAKTELEQYRLTAFPGYEAVINVYLTRFNAGFRIRRVSAVDTRGGPTCNYEIVINDVSIPVAGGNERPGDHGFRNTLSSGDRNALALACFFTSIDRDPDPVGKVVVIDDPISSLDQHRSLTTVQELRRLEHRVSQVIILSHDKSLLCNIRKGIDRARCTTMKIVRDVAGSTLAVWDANEDSVTEHDRRHAALRAFLRDGLRDNGRDVATYVRPVLEGFLRVAFPEHFPPEQMLGNFLEICSQRCGIDTEILNDRDTEELRALVEYGNLFHHETNPAYRDVVVNDGELRGFVGRVLQFASRSQPA